MSTLPETIELDGATLIRIDAPDDIACWTAGLEGGDGGWTVSIIAEPAEEPSAQALEAAQGIVTEFAELSEAAIGYLVEELAGPGGDLSDADRARLAAAEPPFGAPEAVVWQDGTWMLRFAECGLEIGDEYGVGVMFAGRTPVAVEDLSDPDDV
ncbi:hypothetical protein [Microbacterium sp. 13-71-7]|jgi:hypothetical protein|uniref:hypothetical protein n=1 Tax=Microbacterium sp. 13-71-7 TaxID=1970399 RepID=UPI000BD41B24|nr:hypothetical protein [Microbacterium sp. 13-71-7]OZB85513.1 MAG: hypothetical protein B7X32_03145 [Microbacterium sp. 13-71-7]